MLEKEIMYGSDFELDKLANSKDYTDRITATKEWLQNHNMTIEDYIKLQRGEK